MKIVTEPQRGRKSYPMDLKLDLTVIVQDNNVDDDNKTPEYPLRDDHPLAIQNKKNFKNLVSSKFPNSSTSFPFPKQTDTVHVGDFKMGKDNNEYKSKLCSIQCEPRLCTSSNVNNTQRWLSSNTFNKHAYVLDKCHCDNTLFQALSLESTSKISVNSPRQVKDDYSSEVYTISSDKEINSSMLHETTGIDKNNVSTAHTRGVGCISITDNNNNAKERDYLRRFDKTLYHKEQIDHIGEMPALRNSMISSMDTMPLSLQITDMVIDKTGHDEDDKNPPFLLRVDQTDAMSDSMPRSPDHNLPPALSPVNSNTKSNSPVFPKIRPNSPCDADVCSITNGATHVESRDDRDYPLKLYRESRTPEIPRTKPEGKSENKDKTNKNVSPEILLPTKGMNNSNHEDINFESKSITCVCTNAVLSGSSSAQRDGIEYQNEDEEKNNNCSAVNKDIPIPWTNSPKSHNCPSATKDQSHAKAENPFCKSIRASLDPPEIALDMCMRETAVQEGIKASSTLGWVIHSELDEDNDPSAHPSSHSSTESLTPQAKASAAPSLVNINTEIMGFCNPGPKERIDTTHTMKDTSANLNKINNTDILHLSAPCKELPTEKETGIVPEVEYHAGLEQSTRTSIVTESGVMIIPSISDTTEEDIETVSRPASGDNIILTIDMPHDIVMQHDHIVPRNMETPPQHAADQNRNRAGNRVTYNSASEFTRTISSAVNFDSPVKDYCEFGKSALSASNGIMDIISLSHHSLPTIQSSRCLTPVASKTETSQSQISLSTRLTLVGKPITTRCYPYKQRKPRNKDQRLKNAERQTLKCLSSRSKSVGRSHKYLSCVNSLRTPIVSSMLGRNLLSSKQSTGQTRQHSSSKTTTHSLPNSAGPKMSIVSTTPRLFESVSRSDSSLSSSSSLHKMRHSPNVDQTPGIHRSGNTSWISDPSPHFVNCIDTTSPQRILSSTPNHILPVTIPFENASPLSTLLPSGINSVPETPPPTTVTETIEFSDSPTSQSKSQNVEQNERAAQTSFPGRFHPAPKGTETAISSCSSVSKFQSMEQAICSMTEPQAIISSSLPYGQIHPAEQTARVGAEAQSDIINSNDASFESNHHSSPITIIDLCDDEKQDVGDSVSSIEINICPGPATVTNSYHDSLNSNMASSSTSSDDAEIFSFMTTYVNRKESKSLSNNRCEHYSPPTDIAIVRKRELCDLEELASQEDDVSHKVLDSERPNDVTNNISPVFLNDRQLITVEEEGNHACNNIKETTPARDKSSLELPLKDFFTSNPDKKSYSSLAQAAIQSKKHKTSRKSGNNDDKDVLTFLSTEDFNGLSRAESVPFLNNSENGEIIDLTCDGSNDEILCISSDNEETGSADSDERDNESPCVVEYEMEIPKNTQDCNSNAFGNLNINDNDNDNDNGNDNDNDNDKPDLVDEVKSDLLLSEDSENKTDSGSTMNNSVDKVIKSRTSSMNSKDTVKCLADHIKRRALKMSLEKKAEVSAKIHSIIVEKSDLLPESLRTNSILPGYCNEKMHQEDPRILNPHVNGNGSLRNEQLDHVTSLSPEVRDIPENPQMMLISREANLTSFPVTRPDHSELALPLLRANANTNHYRTTFNPLPTHLKPNTNPIESNPGYLDRSLRNNENNSVLNLSTKRPTTTGSYRTVWCSQFVGGSSPTLENKKRRRYKSRSLENKSNTRGMAQVTQSRMEGSQGQDRLIQTLKLLHAAKVIDPVAVKAAKTLVPSLNASSQSDVGVSIKQHSRKISTPGPVDLSLHNNHQKSSSDQKVHKDSSFGDTVSSNVTPHESPTIAACHPFIYGHGHETTHNTSVGAHHFDGHTVHPLNHAMQMMHCTQGLPLRHISELERILRQRQKDSEKHTFPNPVSNSQQTFVNSIPNSHVQIDQSVNPGTVTTKYPTGRMLQPQNGVDILFDNGQCAALNGGSGDLNVARTHNRKDAIQESIDRLVYCNPTNPKQRHQMENEHYLMSASKLPYSDPAHVQESLPLKFRAPTTLVASNAVGQLQHRLAVPKKKSPIDKRCTPCYTLNGTMIGPFARHADPTINVQAASNPQFHPTSTGLRLPYVKDINGPVSLMRINGNSLSQQPCHLANHAPPVNIKDGSIQHPHSIDSNNVLLPLVRPSQSKASSGQPFFLRAGSVFHPRQHIVQSRVGFDPVTHRLPNTNAMDHVPQNKGFAYNHVPPILLHCHSVNGKMEQNPDFIIRDGIKYRKSMIFTFPHGPTDNLVQHLSADETNSLKCNPSLCRRKRKSRTKEPGLRRRKNRRTNSEKSLSDTERLVINEVEAADNQSEAMDNRIDCVETINDQSVPKESTVLGCVNLAGNVPCDNRRLDAPSVDRGRSFGEDTSVVGSNMGKRDSRLTINAAKLKAAGGISNAPIQNDLPPDHHPQIVLNDSSINNSFDSGVAPGTVESRSDSGFSDSLNTLDPLASTDLEYVVEEYEENGISFVSFKSLEDEEEAGQSAACASFDIDVDVNTRFPVEEQKVVLKVNENNVPVQGNSSYSQGVSSLILASQKLEASNTEYKHSINTQNKVHSQQRKSQGTEPEKCSSPCTDLTKRDVSSRFYTKSPVKSGTNFDGNNTLYNGHQAIAQRRGITEDEKQVADLLVSMLQTPV